MLGIDPRAARATWTVILIALLCLTIYAIRNTLFIFIVSLLFAYLLLPLVDFIDRFLPWRRSRGPALVIVYIFLVAGLVSTGIVIGSRVAEQAKIALSTSDSAPIDVFNIGDDLAGNPIEHSVPITRAQLEKQMEPLLAKCLELTRRALDGARMTAADIDRVIMVGGPTQMPIVRQALISMMGDKLDFSIDPMTVVAQGAALYASTLERTIGTAEVPSQQASMPGAKSSDQVAIRLNHERASGTPKSPIAGTAPAGSRLHEIKIDGEGGVWHLLPYEK